MKIKLVADSGSTKTAWGLIQDKKPIIPIETVGYSPQYVTSSEIIESLQQSLLPNLAISAAAVAEVEFYGTGCSTPRTVEIVAAALRAVFPKAAVSVQHDLLGAARALCGKAAGIACILGTGANACVFDGEKIVQDVPSVGFMLGDEGSGGYLGKQLVRAYFYGLLPQDLSAAFAEKYNLSRDEMLRQVYKMPAPNRYLASFAPFLKTYETHPFIQKMLQDAFQDFLEIMVLRYADARNLPVHFLGSIALNFQTHLSEALQRNGLTAGRFVKDPIEALANWHDSEN